MSRCRTGTAALFVVGLLAACDSSGDGATGPDPVAEAKTFRCPSATALGTALRSPQPKAHRSTIADRTVICSYVDVGRPGIDPIVTITFGVGRGQLKPLAAVAANGNRIAAVSGVGEAAYVVGDKQNAQLFVANGGRAISVTGDTTATAPLAAVAKLFF